MRRVFAALLAVCVVWLYAGIARALVVEWFASADASYGLILAAVVLVLVWRRRPLIHRTDDGVIRSTAAVGMVLSGLVLYLAGLFAADQFATRVSFVVVAAGMIWFLAGAAALRLMAAPLFFLRLAIPLPQLVVNTSTLPLQVVASRIAEVVLTTAGVPVFRDGSVLELPSVTLQIVEACSGLRSAVSLVSVGALLAWSIGGPVGCRLMLVAAAVPIAVCMNGIRVAATGVASEAWGPEITRGAWHTATGWMTFVLSLAMLLGLEHLMSRRRGAPVAAEIVTA